MASKTGNLKKIEEEEDSRHSEIDEKNESQDPDAFITGLAHEELKDAKTEALDHLDTLVDGIDS